MTKLPEIIVYSKDDCPWCDKAKDLLTKNGLPYTLLMYGVDYTKEDLQNKLGPNAKLTTPQIFFNGELIGGYQELDAYMSIANMVDKLMKG